MGVALNCELSNSMCSELRDFDQARWEADLEVHTMILTEWKPNVNNKNKHPLVPTG